MKLLSFTATLLLASALTSCSLLTQQATAPEDAAETAPTEAAAAPENKNDAEPLGPVTIPSEEEQAAAAAMLREQAAATAAASSSAAQTPDDPVPAVSTVGATTSVDAPAAQESGETTIAPMAEAPIPAPDEASALPPLPVGKLRMGNIIPQEDPASTGDAPPPTANSAERFGLRSPKMPSKLPMGIDGKLKNGQ